MVDMMGIIRGWLTPACLLLPTVAPAQTPLRDQPVQEAPDDGGPRAGDDITVTGSRLANASINGIVIDPILLPQNVRVLDSKLVAQTGVTDLSQLYDLAGSMARQNNFGGAWDAYAIRGFAGDPNLGPDLLVNRFNANRGYNPRRDIATVESFQVLKGPAAALSGKGEPGGSINIVTKAPLDHTHAAANLSYASFDTVRLNADVGGPAAGGLATRMIATWQDSRGFRDYNPNSRLLIAPSIAWRASDRVRFLYQLEYNLVDFVHDRGVLAVGSDAKALPRTRFLGEPNDGQAHQRTSQHQGSMTVDLADGVALEGGLQYRDGTLRGQASHIVAVVGTRARRQLRQHYYDWQDLTGRVEVSARRTLLGIEHQARIGGDAYSYDLRNVYHRSAPTDAAPYDIDIYDPVYGQPKPAVQLNQDTLEQQRGRSLYAQDLLVLDRRFSLLLGIRHDWITQRLANYRLGTVSRQTPSVTSPRAAFTFAPSEEVSAYVSWGRSFRFNQGVGADARAFAPERGTAWEGGVKYALFDHALTGTASVYQIDKINVLISDGTGSGFSKPAGEARSQGFEADATLAVDRRFDLTAVYAYTDARVIRDTRPNMSGAPLSNVPRHSGAIYGHWTSAANDPGSIGIGVGLTYVGSRPGDDANTGFRLPGYCTARLNLSWQVTKGIAARLDADNLFDAYYLESSYNRNWIAPGAPRTLRAGLVLGL